MATSIKRFTFAANNYGLSWIDINIQTWQIVDACGAARNLVNRACRLTRRGDRIEYREGERYNAINVDIEKMG